MYEKQNGISFEIKMIEALNGKHFKDLNENLRSMVKFMFGDVSDDELVYAEIIDEDVKPDFYVTCKGIKHSVSYKHGKSKQFHAEGLKQFVLWLRDQGISMDSQKTFVLYHYGDGTYTGKGERRFNNYELMHKYEERIKKLNKELNAKPSFVKKFLNRIMFKGTHEEYPEAEFIYLGGVRHGIIVSKDQIMKHFARKQYPMIKIPHIGPIGLRPHARYIDSEVFDVKRRETIDFCWFEMAGELELISEKYGG